MPARRLAALVLALALPGVASAGELTPPGAPGPSMKTLEEVEPRIAINAVNTPGDADSAWRITKSGHYYLTQSYLVLGFPSATHGIEIAASDVTIDLNGFTIRGLSGALSGIRTDAPGFENLVIRNGTIRNFSQSGIDLRTNESSHATLIEVRLLDNGLRGAYLGDDARAIRCRFEANGSDGLAAGHRATVEDCAVVQNGGHGVDLGWTSTVRSSIFESNGAFPAGRSIRVGDGSIVASARVTNATVVAVAAGSRSLVTDTVVLGAGDDGIRAGAASIVENCVVTFASATGITVGESCIVRENIVSNSGFVGILPGTRTTVSGNRVTFSDDAGISVAGDATRLEGNEVFGNDIGIRALGARSLVTGNIVGDSASTNWSISPGNLVGPIIDLRFPGGGAISGNSSAGNLTTVDPHANFTN
ncbi:MAG: right-handed parallel beta-helix repeat-containing protein [Phycisphaerales bacterium]